MKKQYSILSVMFVLTLSFFLASCGAKKDEALVTEFNAKKTDADKMISSMQDNQKMMMADHSAWNAKLDSAEKAGADKPKIDGFRAEMKKHEDLGKSAGAWADSIKTYENAKTDNNDQLKAAIAGIDAQMAASTSATNNLMDMHKKLGADIMTFLGGAATAAPTEAPKEEAKGGKKAAEKVTPAPAPGQMDMSKHAAPPPKPGGTRRQSGGTIVK